MLMHCLCRQLLQRLALEASAAGLRGALRLRSLPSRGLLTDLLSRLALLAIRLHSRFCCSDVCHAEGAAPGAAAATALASGSWHAPLPDI